MSDLAARVLAAIADEERFANNARGLLGIENPWWTWQALKARFPDLSRADCVHISRHGARDSLRRCAADRKIVELHTPKPADVYVPWLREKEQPGYGCGTCHYDYDSQEIMRLGVCSTLKALAEGYGIEVGQ